jgi:hypothetical protein
MKKLWVAESWESYNVHKLVFFTETVFNARMLTVVLTVATFLAVADIVRAC